MRVKLQRKEYILALTRQFILSRKYANISRANIGIICLSPLVCHHVDYSYRYLVCSRLKSLAS